MTTANRLGPIYDSTRNTGLPYMSFIYIGFVKANDDGQRMGRLSVWIPEIGGEPDDPASWIICSYASPFAGASDITKIAGYTTNNQVAQQSYGLWAVPPDLNNEVAVFFANGDITRAFWFACTYQQSMNWMVPGVAVNLTTEPEPPKHVSPVIEYNKADKNITVDSPRRPPFKPLTNGLKVEGLVSDNERGSASTSARREAPSQVFGMLSPRANNMHIDDNTENEFIRLRTRSGAQVLIHETTGYIYINSKNGNAWLEVSDAGVDVYSRNSISLRAEQDFNVRADRNILFDAGGSINMRAAGQLTIDTGKDINIKTNTNIILDTSKNGDVQINSGRAIMVTAATNGSLHFGENLRLKADKDMNVETDGDTTLKAGGVQVRDGKTIYDNAGLAPSADITEAGPATVPKTRAALDTTQAITGGQLPGQWKHGGSTVQTITSRMPTHEPWAGHPNSKVPPPPLEDIVPYNGGSFMGGGASNIGPDGQLLNDDGCSFGTASTKSISTENYNAIAAASDKVGVPLPTMLAFGDIESSFQAGVNNKTGSSAKGMFQFIDGTWKGMVTQYGNQYNISSDPNEVYNPNSNALMGAQLLKNSTAKLQSMGITDPTPGQLYVMHMMGDGGGPALIRAAQSTPDASASLMFPNQAASNPVFAGKTVKQVYDSLTGMADAKAKAYANQQGLPSPCERIASGSNTGRSGSTEKSEAQLKAKYGDPRDSNWKAENITTITTKSGAKIQVNKQDAASFQGLIGDLEDRGYVIKPGDTGGYNLRNITGGNTLSYHAFGAAIDINATANPYSNAPGGGVLKTNLPPDVSDMAKKWGLQWGGDWSSLKDPMHFQKI